MQFPEQNVTSLKFIPARLTEGKEWYISFYAYNPVSASLQRKKIKLNRVESTRMRREIARKMILEINTKLLSGWSPFIEIEAGKSYHKFSEALETYWKNIEKQIEDNTKRCYIGFIGKLNDWLVKQKKKDIYVYQFDKYTASEFMLYIFTKDKIAVRTYNNNLTFFKALFNWLVQFNYIKENPFKTLSKKPIKKQKNRVPIPPEIRLKLSNYLKDENTNFLTIMLIVYYCLLRPNEVTFLKPKHINIEKRLITVDGATAKNDNTSFRTVPDSLIEYLKPILAKCKPDEYLFADDLFYSFSPGKKHLDPRKISRYWDKLRVKFDLPMEYKFYSIKDTGIIDLLDAGVSVEDVREQADHSDLKITSIYARHSKPLGSEQIRKLARDF